MINIISAIGSIGTFIMALFYFVSVSIQLYQMKITFIPALGFNQILLSLDKDNQLQMINTSADSLNHQDYLKMYNLGGGAAKDIKIEILLDEDSVIQKKYVSILPSKESYLLPINKDVFDELQSTIQNNGYESHLNIKITYYHNVSRKEKMIMLNGKLDRFNTYEEKALYELQFINK
ncbi:hypothetical protein [Staphylococcus nepalensis]|uniref:Membrane protein n=1 Tax=Staphylococcus nepalensis TaxID=214473 RepID=A0A2T4SEF0_9STAP|nr:hypothetical protein [Staphylococcus nepalensis]VDG68208.1 Uncharacterised protein [Lacrimispora indolis]PNZ97523.1 hypothetical protein CD130_08035 [Staphylococcus nepalensis]PTK61020.1 hypothetical protein BUZ61_00375 [Staphylococcus nepalensis]SUM56232.1 membrane protein [Staphylococcus nepalensis]GGB83258.1 hypothetical protein GCM10007203_13120 [Staphylococcus nepalensis]